MRPREEVRTYPAHVPRTSWRIDAPGEALLALTVGGIAHFVDANALCAPKARTAMSIEDRDADCCSIPDADELFAGFNDLAVLAGASEEHPAARRNP